jgi:hypothetical protein
VREKTLTEAPRRRRFGSDWEAEVMIEAVTWSLLHLFGCLMAALFISIRFRKSSSFGTWNYRLHQTTALCLIVERSSFPNFDTPLPNGKFFKENGNFKFPAFHFPDPCFQMEMEAVLER